MAIVAETPPPASVVVSALLVVLPLLPVSTAFVVISGRFPELKIAPLCSAPVESFAFLSEFTCITVVVWLVPVAQILLSSFAGLAGNAAANNNQVANTLVGIV